MPSASRATSLRRFHPCGSSRSRARPRDVLADDPERREAMTRRKVAGVLLGVIAATGQQGGGGGAAPEGGEKKRGGEGGGGSQGGPKHPHHKGRGAPDHQDNSTRRDCE